MKNACVIVLQRLAHEEAGADMVEYGLVLALVAVAAAVAFQMLGNTISNEFSNISDQLAGLL